MAKTILVNRMSTGEISESLAARTDWPQRANGLLLCRNLLPLPQGGVVKRPGLERVASIDGAQRIFAWHKSDSEKFLLAQKINGQHKLINTARSGLVQNYEITDVIHQDEDVTAYDCFFTQISFTYYSFGGQLRKREKYFSMLGMKLIDGVLSSPITLIYIKISDFNFNNRREVFVNADGYFNNGIRAMAYDKENVYLLDSTGRLMKIDLAKIKSTSNFSVEVIGETGIANATGFDIYRGAGYATAPTGFYTINLSDAATTNPSVVNDDIKGMAIKDGVGYATKRIAGNTSLYTVNLATGIDSPQREYVSLGAVEIIGLSFAGNDLYGLGDNNHIYKLSTAADETKDSGALGGMINPTLAINSLPIGSGSLFDVQKTNLFQYADTGIITDRNRIKHIKKKRDGSFEIDNAVIKNPPLILFAETEDYIAELYRLADNPDYRAPGYEQNPTEFPNGPPSRFCAQNGEQDDAGAKAAREDSSATDMGERVYEWKYVNAEDGWQLVARHPKKNEVGKPAGSYAMAWNDIDGWPIDCCVRDQRLVYAGTTKHPATLWMSVIGNANSFLDEKAAFIPDGETEDATAPNEVRADFAITRSLDTFETITNILSDTSLMVFTEGGEWALDGNLKADDIATGFARKFSSFGTTANTGVASIDEMVYFYSGSAAFSNYYDSNFKGYVPVNITATRNEKILAAGVKRVVAAQPKDLNGAFLVFFLMQDGNIKVWNTLHKQEHFAWASWDFAGANDEALFITDIAVVDNEVFVLSDDVIYKLSRNAFTDDGNMFECELETVTIAEPQYLGESWLLPKTVCEVSATFGVFKSSQNPLDLSTENNTTYGIKFKGCCPDPRDISECACPNLVDEEPPEGADVGMGSGKRLLQCAVKIEEPYSNDDKLRVRVSNKSDADFVLYRIDVVVEIESVI